MEAENASIYDMFFEMQLSICERFPSLTPFDVRKQPFAEVFLLIRRLHKSNDNKSNGESNKDKSKRIAASDNWF